LVINLKTAKTLDLKVPLTLQVAALDSTPTEGTVRAAFLLANQPLQNLAAIRSLSAQVVQKR
jgi:hypothetical protein